MFPQSSLQFILHLTTEVIDVCLGRLPSNLRNFYAHLISSKERANHKTFCSRLKLLLSQHAWLLQNADEAKFFQSSIDSNVITGLPRRPVLHQHAARAAHALPHDLLHPARHPLLLRHLLRLHHAPLHQERQVGHGGGRHRRRDGRAAPDGAQGNLALSNL